MNATRGALVCVVLFVSLFASVGCRTVPAPAPAKPSYDQHVRESFLHPIPKMEWQVPTQPKTTDNRPNEVHVTFFKLEVNAAPTNGDIVIGAQGNASPIR